MKNEPFEDIKVGRYSHSENENQPFCLIESIRISCVVSGIHKVGIKRMPYEKCFLQRENEYV